MITIDLGTLEYYDEEANEFHYEEGGIVRFEYSLKTMYEWEAKWKKPFLSGDYTDQEMKDFFHMMALDPMDKRFLSKRVMKELSNYIETTPTATTFSNHGFNQNGNNNGNGKIHTAEEIYALMFLNQIPLEFEERNLNRLLIILRIIGSYTAPKKKMRTEDIYAQNRRINAERKAKYNTKG